eukprot:124204-Pleurochrysis_carterae.AAC.2
MSTNYLDVQAVPRNDHPPSSFGVSPFEYTCSPSKAAITALLYVASSCPCDWLQLNTSRQAISGRIILVPPSICHSSCSLGRLACAAMYWNASALLVDFPVQVGTHTDDPEGGDASQYLKRLENVTSSNATCGCSGSTLPFGKVSMAIWNDVALYNRTVSATLNWDSKAAPGLTHDTGIVTLTTDAVYCAPYDSAQQVHAIVTFFWVALVAAWALVIFKLSRSHTRDMCALRIGRYTSGAVLDRVRHM